ncbi:MAG: LCP family protein, partial [Candidatus Gracilibacteria bacterium]
MDFRIRKIRRKIAQNEPRITLSSKERRQVFNMKKSLIAFGIIIILLLTGIIQTVKSINFSAFLSAMGGDLLTDNKGHTNFLLLGTGGGIHEGADLTDTIIVASFDPEKESVTLVSIPRDLWIDDNKIGGSRINEIYFNAKKYYKDDSAEALEKVKDKVEEVIGTSIQYYIKLDFDGFKD